MLTRNKHLLAAVIAASIAVWSGMTIGAADHQRSAKHPGSRMSSMARSAARSRSAIKTSLPGEKTGKDFEETGVCVNEPDCEDDGPAETGPASTQSETS